jgi:hypothetical protein
MQIGGHSITPRLVSIPYREAKIILTYAENNEAGSPSVDIQVETNSSGQTLLNHMYRGDLHLANMVSDSALRKAENLLYQKLREPIEATIGAYFLLKTHAFDEMHNWAENLAKWFAHISDGTIIYAWKLLEQNPDDEKIQEARHLLLTAVEKPLPLFTQGLRLLYEGLSLFDEDQKGKDREVRLALEQIRPYAHTADWSTFTTTFFGENPYLPTLKLRGQEFGNEDEFVLALRYLSYGGHNG